jgi:hypothetical protein
MGSGVVKVGRRTYAVGLFWQPSPSGRVAQAAREAALQPGQQTDFYCVRPASKSVAVPQYGLGQSALGHKVGMPTLAASLANVQPGSWAGAFRLREGTWVIVVRDDLVAPDGDIIFDSDETARERLLQEIALGGVQRIYAPDGWSIPGSDPTPLPLLLQDRTDCRLQPVAVPIKMVIYGAAAVAAIVLVIFVALQYQAEMEKQEAERVRQERIKSGALGGLAQEWKWPPADQVYPKMWESRPLAKDSFSACQGLLAVAPATQYGWKKGFSTCQDGTLNVLWHHDAGRRAAMPEKATISDQGTSASQYFKNSTLTSRGPQELLSEAEVTRLALTQAWPVALSRLADDQPIVKPPANVKNTAAALPVAQAWCALHR